MDRTSPGWLISQEIALIDRRKNMNEQRLTRITRWAATVVALVFAGFYLSEVANEYLGRPAYYEEMNKTRRLIELTSQFRWWEDPAKRAEVEQITGRPVGIPTVLPDDGPPPLAPDR